MARDLTAKQLKVLRLATKYEHDTGELPRISQLADRLNISPVAVRHHLQALLQKGAVATDGSPVRTVCREAKVARAP
jgi:predicted ArsR family transcriptional regulator